MVYGIMSVLFFFFFKQKTAYEMRISDWSSECALPIYDPPPGTLALVTAVAVHEAVSLYIRADEISIKWPNDLLVGRAKLSGVLLERMGDAIVIGDRKSVV